VRGVGSLRTRVSIKLRWRAIQIFQDDLRGPGWCAAAASLPSITFNLLAQTSQLAARINLGHHRRGEGSKKKTKRPTEGREQRQRQLALQPDEDEPGTERGDNRPITWLTEDDRSREPGNRSLYGQCDESGKTDPQSRQPRPRRPRRLTPRPARCRFCSLLPLLLETPARSEGPNASIRCYPPPPPPPLSIVAVHAVHLPVDEESFALSVLLLPRLHSRQLMSHRPQGCTAYLLRISLLCVALSSPPAVLCRRPFAKVD